MRQQAFVQMVETMTLKKLSILKWPVNKSLLRTLGEIVVIIWLMNGANPAWRYRRAQSQSPIPLTGVPGFSPLAESGADLS